jgi:hypothetical protein
MEKLNIITNKIFSKIQEIKNLEIMSSITDKKFCSGVFCSDNGNFSITITKV